MLNGSYSTIQAKHFDSQTSRWLPTYSSNDTPIVSNHTADDQFSHGFAPSFLTVKAILPQSNQSLDILFFIHLSRNGADSVCVFREHWQSRLIFKNKYSTPREVA